MKHLYTLFSKNDVEWGRQMANENLDNTVPKKCQADKAIGASL